MAFGTYIRKKREEAGLSLTDFARRIDISPAGRGSSARWRRHPRTT